MGEQCQFFLFNIIAMLYLDLEINHNYYVQREISSAPSHSAVMARYSIGLS